MAAMGSKIQTLERNWRRVASTHTLQDLMNADKPPSDTRISIKILFGGILLITAGAACLTLGILTFGAPWLLPTSSNSLLEAVRTDKYYHLLVPAMVPVTIITATMENHNFAQTPGKSLADHFPHVPDFHLLENGIPDDLAHFLNSPVLFDHAGLENIWLASPWPRGAGAPNQYSHPQDVLYFQRGMQSAAVPLDPAANAQTGIANNPIGFLLRSTPNNLQPPPFPKLDAPSCCTIATQTSPGLGCDANGNRFAQKRPPAKETRSIATSPLVAANTAVQSRKQYSAPVLGPFTSPLLKRAKLGSSMPAPSRPLQHLVQHQQQQRQQEEPANNTNVLQGEITGTSLPSNAPVPSRGAKALSLAKTGPSTLNKTAQRNIKKPLGRPSKKNKNPAAATKRANPIFQENNNTTSRHMDSLPSSNPPSGSHPSTFTAPTATATAATDSANITGATTSQYEDLMCEVCGLGEPDESIVICERCDAGFHVWCLSPALKKVPEGDWFCDCCCEELGAQPHHQRRHHEEQLAAAQSRQQHQNAGVGLDLGGGIAGNASGTAATNPQAAKVNPPLPPAPPLSKAASRILELFSSSDVSKMISRRTRAQLQIFIYLAENNEANAPEISLHYGNPDVTLSTSSLRAAGLIVPVERKAGRRYTYYALSPIVSPTVDLWKQRLEVFNKILDAAPETTAPFDQDDDEETESENESDDNGTDIDEDQDYNNSFTDDDSLPRCLSVLPTNARAAEANPPPLPPAPPLNKAASRILALFGSPNVSEGISLHTRARLQTLIYLAENKQATTSEMRKYYGNLGIRNAVTSLRDIGLIVQVQRKVDSRFDEYVLSSIVPPAVDLWKRRLETFNQVLDAAPAVAGLPHQNEVDTSSSLFQSLCSENANKKGEKPSALLSLCRCQLQTLVYLAEHENATAKDMVTYYNNSNIRNAMTTLVTARMIRSAGKLRSLGNPPLYVLAPEMKQYLPIWKKKLENDALARAPRGLQVNKN